MVSDCSCKTKKNTHFKSSWLSIIGGVFIALIPKCPFCILAYSSAITLCSGKKLYEHSPDWASYISIALAVFTFAIVLYNYKGTKTIIAAILILAGSSFIVVSEMYTGELTQYNIGAGLLLLGVWLNANLMYFVRKYLFKNLPKNISGILPSSKPIS